MPSKFDFILGFQPEDNNNGNTNNTTPNTSSNKFYFTGQILADLQNPFGTGKRFMVKWNKTQRYQSDLKALANYPYILNTPFGLEYDFYLFRIP